MKRLRSSELLKKYGISLKKSLGQNILLDPNINRKMAGAAAVGPEDSVVEVGSGVGDLTEELARRAGRVLTIEIDPAFEPALRERFGENPRVTVFIGDALNRPVEELVEKFLPGAEKLKMVSNLPYYITSPILMHFLESGRRFVSLTVMAQREVAERIVATPGGKDYGILSVACQFYSRPYIVHRVSPKCFRPVPKVESAIVHLPLRTRLELTERERELFFEIVRSAFGQRRKKIINALASTGSPLFSDKERLREALESAGVSPDSRAEKLSVSRFKSLARHMSEA